MSNKTLYIFIDESGNFDFSPSGTKHFALTAISTTYPLKNRKKIFEYRYNLLCNGTNQECFHATEDKQKVRDQIYKFINSHNDYFVDSVIAQKNRANPSLYIKTYKKRGETLTSNTGAELYRILCQTLLQYIFRRFNNADIDQIVVILDAVFTNNKRGLILKTLKSYLKKYFPKPFYIYFHQAKSDINCQIADYCSWAIYVKNEKNEQRPYKCIQKKVKSEFLIFERGNTEYY